MRRLFGAEFSKSRSGLEKEEKVITLMFFKGLARWDMPTLTIVGKKC
jgi:hypothetical protein